MSEEKPVYWTPGYTPKDTEQVLIAVPVGNGISWARDWDFVTTSSDAGWSQFQRDYPDACPKCKASNGLDINRKCQYCDYDNSPKQCSKCDGHYFGESYTKPLCQICYDKAALKRRKANERRRAKQQKEAEERAERERLAWRAETELNDKGEISLLLDLYDDYGDIVPSLTIEQTEDLIEKLERTLQDAKKKKSI